MIKFPSYSKSPFDAYKEAVGRCHDPKKDVLTSIEKGIENCYAEYDEMFKAGQVHNLTRHKFTTTQANFLRSLYSSDAAICKDLRKHFNSNLPNRVYWNVCPYCTLNRGNTLEHIMPKELFPEYAIHAYNLIPCCSTCNSNKGTKIKDSDGIPYTLNFFYHDPDSFQFLRVDVSLDGSGYPQFKYSLDFPTGCDKYLKSVIINHFDKIHLIEKYEDKVISKYPEDDVKIVDELMTNSVDDVLHKILGWVNLYSLQYGKNHYYVAMLRGLISSSDYREYLEREKAKLRGH